MSLPLYRIVGASLIALLSAIPARAETVQTRIGPLTFDVGYPTAETAARLYDELDFQRATQAYIWALPAVGFHALHLAHLNRFGAPDGTVVLYQDLKDKAGMLTPNITTLYALSFWDLAAQGPLVIEVPAGLTAGGVLDIWQRPITDMGQTGPDRGQGGKYLILPPGAAGIAPEDHVVVRSPSNQVWIASRGLDPDRAVAEATMRQHRLYAWEAREAPPETPYVPVGGRDWQSAHPADLTYWQYLSDLFANDPVEDRDRVMFAMLRPLGLVPGQPFAPDARQARILAEAAQMGDLMARTIAYDKRLDGSEVYPGKHWEYANLVELDQEAAGYTQIDERGRR